MRVLIVDDEPLAQHIVVEFCQRIPLIQSIKVADSAVEAFDILKSEQFDILFLDIQMPEMDGLTLARFIPNKQTQIIFTTAYSEYALDAFDLNVVDYLMKPFSFERFEKAVQKVIERSSKTANKESKDTKVTDSIFLKVDGEFRKCRLSDIVYLESVGNYVKIHHVDGKVLLVSSTMKTMEDNLPEEAFFRIHSSYMIAISQVEMLVGNVVQLSSNIELPIARNRKDNLYERLHIKD